MKSLSFEFPFNPQMSENCRLNYNPKSGRYFASTSYKLAKHALSMIIRGAATRAGLKFQPKKKLNVEFTVYKPNHHSDAPNFTKCILDAAAAALNLNDNYFTSSVDWEIDKKNPRFSILITQND